MPLSRRFNRLTRLYEDVETTASHLPAAQIEEIKNQIREYLEDVFYKVEIINISNFTKNGKLAFEVEVLKVVDPSDIEHYMSYEFETIPSDNYYEPDGSRVTEATVNMFKDDFEWEFNVGTQEEIISKEESDLPFDLKVEDCDFEAFSLERGYPERSLQIDEYGEVDDQVVLSGTFVLIPLFN